MPIIVNNPVRKLNGSSLRDHMKIHSRQELAHGPFHFFAHPPLLPHPPPGIQGRRPQDPHYPHCGHSRTGKSEVT